MLIVLCESSLGPQSCILDCHDWPPHWWPSSVAPKDQNFQLELLSSHPHSGAGLQAERRGKDIGALFQLGKHFLRIPRHISAYISERSFTATPILEAEKCYCISGFCVSSNKTKGLSLRKERVLGGFSRILPGFSTCACIIDCSSMELIALSPIDVVWGQAEGMNAFSIG